MELRRALLCGLGMIGLASAALSCTGTAVENESSAQTAAATDRSAPRLRALGTAQDGGLPHVACSCRRCVTARENPAERRNVASVGLILPAEEQVFIIDATPDLGRQIAALEDVRAFEPGRVDRTPVDGVLLTHAHIGHYLGLAFFGFETVYTRDLPVWCSPKMQRFLDGNEPFRTLIRSGNIRPVPVVADRSFRLGPVEVTGFPVPHRDELSDTLGFVIAGPTRRVLYVPDTDSWDAWGGQFEERIGQVDVAILDGSFFSLAELPGRDVTTIGHPLIEDSMNRLQGAVDRGELEVYFTHFNHSNPALEPDTPEREETERRGFHILEDGDEIAL